MISSSHRPLLTTPNKLKTDKYPCLGEIRSRCLSRTAASDSRLRPQSISDRPNYSYYWRLKFELKRKNLRKSPVKTAYASVNDASAYSQFRDLLSHYIFKFHNSCNDNIVTTYLISLKFIILTYPFHVLILPTFEKINWWSTSTVVFRLQQIVVWYKC